VRCADGAGASAVVLTDRRVRVNHPLAVKASMGTIFTVPVIDATVDDAVRWARSRRLRVIAADPAATSSYRGDHYCGPVALVLGSERYGLSDAWRKNADVLVSIPMLGTADSLNVGHAAALLLYEVIARG
jgi:TrmH family RNA methyltransferase